MNYSENNPANWAGGIHWRRLTEMALTYRTPSSAYFESNDLKNSIIKGVDYWLANYTRPQNAWWELIGIPYEMGKTFILLEKEIGAERIKQAMPLMNLAVLPDIYNYHGKATGQNLLWETFIHIHSSALTGDTAGLRRAYETSYKEIIITKNEGIQPDFSFHQHGAQSYAFGYGKAFSLSAAQILFSSRGTAFAAPKSKIDLISNYILDGQQWCSRAKMLEYTAMGREIARPETKSGSIAMASQLMSFLDSERKNEYLDFIAQLRGKKRNQELTGNKYFPYIDFMVEQGSGFFFSVKAVSKKIVSTEMGNGENLKGYHLGRGTQFIVRRGDEYEGIFPIWDWEKIPGSLCEQTGQKLPIYNWSKGAEGNTTFVLGVSNGKSGCFTYDYNKDGVKAHRSWFCFGNKIVVMVAALNHQTTHNVYHSINQSFLKSDVYADSKLMSTEMLSKSRVRSVWHDSIAYLFQPSDYNIQLSRKNQSGSWHDISTAQSNDSITKPVFSVGIDLGKTNDKGSFAYTIVPNCGIKDVQKLAASKTISILQNTAEQQIVWNTESNCLQAVIYSPSVITLPWQKMQLELTKPGILVIKRVGNSLKMTVQQEGVKAQEREVIINLHDKIKL